MNKYLNLKNNITDGGYKDKQFEDKQFEDKQFEDKPLNSPITHNMKLADEWFNYVKNGEKTIEGRVLDKKRKLLDVGDFIIFTNNHNKKKMVKTEITLLEEIIKPTSFKKAINEDNFLKLIPSAKNIEDVVKVYDNISEYKEGAEKHGIVLIHLKLVE